MVINLFWRKTRLQSRNRDKLGSGGKMMASPQTSAERKVGLRGVEVPTAVGRELPNCGKSYKTIV